MSVGEDAEKAVAFGCIIRWIFGGAASDCAAIYWSANDETDETSSHGWTKRKPNGTIQGAICFPNGDGAKFAT